MTHYPFLYVKIYRGGYACMARNNIIDKIHVLVSLDSQSHIPAPPRPRTQTPAVRAIVVLSLGTRATTTTAVKTSLKK